MSKLPCFAAAAVSALAFVSFTRPAHAVLFSNFAEFGQTVNGYQDDFNGNTLNPDWLEKNASPGDPAHFTLSGTGSLLMHAANLDPNKLLYNPVSGYDTTTQNVVALVRMTTEGPNIDGGRGGITAGSDSVTGQGINLLFRQPGQNGNGNHYNLLDDLRAWGPSTDPGVGGPTWTTGQYMWLRLTLDSSGVPSGKIWPAGNTPEPVDSNLFWDARGRAGLAGLTTNSIAGANEFEVDYILIRAGGLPQISVVPEPSTGLLGLAAAGALGLRRRRKA